MKLLSIIIPLYNSAQWLPKCLDSVLNQDVPIEKMEIICINNGSPDNSADIARTYQSRYPTSVVVLDQQNQGPSGARNNGMRHATGKYMCFVDPDDYVEPHVYGALLRQMEREQLDAIRFNYCVENELYQPTEECKFPIPFDYTPKLMTGSEFIAERLQVQCYIWLYIYRRQIISDNHIWCYTGDYFDDTPWLPLVLQKVQRMNVTPTIVQHYIIRSNSLVRADSPRMASRKIEGHKFLQTILREQMMHISDRGVLRWYRTMLSHSAMNLLSLAATHDYNHYSTYITFLRKQNAFPLLARWVSRNARIKMYIANVSPRLYGCICHKRAM